MIPGTPAATPRRDGKRPVDGGRPRHAAARRWALAAPDVWEAYKDGLLRAGQVDVLLELPPGEQLLLLPRVVGLTVDRTRVLVRLRRALVDAPARREAPAVRLGRRVEAALGLVGTGLDALVDALGRRPEVVRAIGGVRAQLLAAVRGAEREVPVLPLGSAASCRRWDRRAPAARASAVRK
ncbi:MAG: hypothetical protein U0807_12960 [Candidatus Binatia bacterium]